MAPRWGRQAHRGREEGPLGCYSSTPSADSMPLGAGGKHTMGGRNAPSGATIAHHVRTRCPSGVVIRGPLPPPTLGCGPCPPGGARWAPWRKRISPTGSKWRAVGKFRINGIGGATGHERYRIPRAWSAEGRGNAWAVLPMTPLPSSLYRARFLWSGLCIARQVRALAMPSRWGEFVTPTRPTTRGFGHVDARSRWLCAARLDNVTPNTGRPCVATVLGGVSRPSNVRASDLIKSQWVLLLRHPAHPCPDPTPLKKQ
ncbi:hypothetical protein V6N13_056449 [Hibiscus sabdariffa]